MKHFKNICTLILLVIFLAGSNGISFFHHFCSCSNTLSTLLYPGVLSAPATCCDRECSAMVPVTDAASSTHLDPAPCCKILRVYYRLLVNSSPVRQDSLQLPYFGTLQVLDSDQTCHREMKIPKFNVFFEFQSPPLYGRSLITYLHQIKIPLPVSFA